MVNHQPHYVELRIFLVWLLLAIWHAIMLAYWQTSIRLLRAMGLTDLSSETTAAVGILGCRE